jgi:predicted Zn-dependent peptidase
MTSDDKAASLEGASPVGERRPLTATLDNGLVVVYEAMPWLPSVTANLVLPFGSASDPQGLEGTATVLHEWLQRGAGDMDSRALSDALEDLGVRRGGGASRESSNLSMSFLASELEAVMPLLAAMVVSPRLDEGEFEPSRELAVQELESLDDSPTQRLFDELLAAFVTSPQGRSPLGTAEGLAALTAESVRTAAKSVLRPAGAVLAVAGGADWERVLAAAQGAFSGWTGEGVRVPPVALATPGRRHVEAETSQVQIGLAFPAPPPGTPEAYVHNVVLNVLSGLSGSRLFTEVREKRGLVYSVSAFYRSLRGFGYTVGYAGTTPERADETLEVFLAELARLAEGVTAEEVERAKVSMLSSLVMQGESSGATASRLAADVFNLGRARTLQEMTSRVQAVTVQDVNEYLARDRLPEPTIVTLGPARVPVAVSA